jgi:hypothetical protein
MQRWARTRVAQRIWLEDSGEKFRVVVGPVPESLIGAMWLQGAWAVSRRAKYQQCESCGRTFEKATGQLTGRRSDARFCSPLCRLHEMRRRKSVERLRTEGRPIKAIASLVERTPQWVRQALKARKSRVRRQDGR